MKQYKNTLTDNSTRLFLSPWVPGFLRSWFSQNEPILAVGWKLVAESCFIKTNPISPFFSKFQGSSKHVYPYSCIPVYLFSQNEPNFSHFSTKNTLI